MGDIDGEYEVVLTAAGSEQAAVTSGVPGHEGVHLAENIFSGICPAFGALRLKIRRADSTTGDFTSLPAEELQEVYLLVDYES